MRLIITADNSDNIFSLDVAEDTELSILKALCASECGVDVDQMVLVYNGRPMNNDSKNMSGYGIKDGDMVMVTSRRRTQHPGPCVTNLTNASSARGVGVGSPGPSRPTMQDDPAVIREMFLSNPDQIVMLRQSNPRLAAALDSGNHEEFDRILREQLRLKQEDDARRLRMLTADPFDPETQKLIAEEIRMKNVDANMEQALEHNPESFGTVVMLYIDCKVNNHHVKAFVDSGAQTTLMSAECAERCGIKRLIDTRWGGIAKGVGTQKITGRVHLAQIQIADCFLASSFSILEDQPMDMLLGLDMLKRHQCIIDLKRNVLVIGTTGRETSFLPESQLPPCARLSGAAADAEAEQDVELAKALEESASSAPRASTSGPQGQGHSQSPSPPLLPSDNFNEGHVNKVMEAGCSRPEAVEALRRANGHLDTALVTILARSLASPK